MQASRPLTRKGARRRHWSSRPRETVTGRPPTDPTSPTEAPGGQRQGEGRSRPPPRPASPLGVLPCAPRNVSPAERIQLQESENHQRRNTRGPCHFRPVASLKPVHCACDHYPANGPRGLQTDPGTELRNEDERDTRSPVQPPARRKSRARSNRGTQGRRRTERESSPGRQGRGGRRGVRVGLAVWMGSRQSA